MQSKLSGALALVLFGIPAVAQQVPETRLSKADASFPVEFSSITGFRELADGRVLITDGIDGVFLRLNLTTGKADTIGRAGAGPGEYKLPDALFPMPNDGTLLVDLGNGRLSLFDRTGKYVESKSMARGEPGLGMMIVLPRATDGQGRIYLQPTGGGPGSRRDSAAVVRYDWKGESFDTLAMVQLPEVKVSQSGGANNRSMSMRAVPLSPSDAWSVGLDGRVAIARASTYRIDWVGPGARVVSGPANPWRPVPIRDAEKKEWMSEAGNGLAIAVSNNNGQMSVNFRRGGMRMGPEPSVDDYEWPEAKPAFVNIGVRVSPDGDAWVERSVAAGSPRAFDVFGPDGKLKRRVVLPQGRRLLGVGKGVIYVRYSDPDDLQILERYRI